MGGGGTPVPAYVVTEGGPILRKGLGVGGGSGRTEGGVMVGLGGDVGVGVVLPRSSLRSIEPPSVTT